MISQPLPERTDYPTVIVDLGTRSAAFDPRTRLSGDALDERAHATEIHLSPEGRSQGQGPEDLLLIYRGSRSSQDGNTENIFFRRHTANPRRIDVASKHTAIHALGHVLLDTLQGSAVANSPLLMHMALALRELLAGHASVTQDAGALRGGLAAWQERRAIAYMEARLDESFSVADVAAECSLSVNHFSRAFRCSVGMPPHRWVLQRRIARARELLTGTALPLADVALACGFAEQSHFTRVFARSVGLPPGAWRRMA
ncbi:AraC-like DNA-binding protein [Luteibacter rhizovicinus]|uniref:AraC-like DNA-binding protein n=1 Tax=Luteibacter rhizovicinus TaxID=242606 RepID=A0A4R3YSP3_9GAMM|nr:AraC family transcriptional regulator [Luteibacter rhizovicinus]TCV95927.1 AraC-like DNA-binding protein [Luteibacter rhizovicinus]